MLNVKKSSIVFLVTLIVVFGLGQILSGADYPSHPIEIIVSGSAGGGTDLTARTFAPFLEKELGVPVEVLNKPGGGGVPAFTNMATADPDGYTIGLVTLPAMTASAVAGDLKIDPLEDYIYLGQVVFNPSAISVKAGSRFKTLKELVQYGKENPEGLTYAATGPRSLKTLTGKGLEDGAGVKFRFVNFKGGKDCIVAVMGGHVDITGVTIAEVLPYAESGDLHVLAVAAKNPRLPGVPTFKELGFALPIRGSTHGFVVPKGTEQEVVKTLRDALRSICFSLEFKNQSEKSGMWLDYQESEQLEKFVQLLLKRLPSILE